MEYMTPADVAREVRIPTAYLWWLQITGRGPRASLAGGRLTYRRVDYDAWVAAHTRTARH